MAKMEEITKKFEAEAAARLKLLDEGKSMAEADAPLLKQAPTNRCRMVLGKLRLLQKLSSRHGTSEAF